jgi:F-type H+-transporting ATPase subunit delta
MTLNFNLPHETIYAGAKVEQVIVPGAAGEYGITADHVPIVAQLKPGVLQILHEGSSEAEKYFVAGGFSITHPDSTTDISSPEAVKIDDIDSAAATSAYEAAKTAYGSAEAGSVDQAMAQIDMEVNKALAAAAGVTLA